MKRNDYLTKIAQYRNIKTITSSMLFVCGVVVGFFIFFMADKDLFNQNKVSTSSRYVNPSLAIWGKENMIIDFQELRESLTKKYEKRDDYLISVYFEYLPTGANISINKDEKIWPASLIKIPVAMTALKKVQDGTWKLSNELVIMDGDKDSEYGDLYKEQTGTTYTIEKFLEESLIRSDNTAHFVLLRNIDGNELEETYVHLGMDDIIDALKKTPKGEEVDNRITAKRYTVFFRSLYNATFLNQEYSQVFLGILKQAPRELLGLGVPDQVDFVHKTGVRIDELVRADAGIVYVPKRPYLITVMVQQKQKGKLNEEEVDALFKSISEEIYTYVVNAH